MLRKTITSLALLTSLFLTVATSAANLSDVPSGKYKMDLTHASIVWKVSHNGLSNYVARFTDFDIDLNLDSDDLAKSSAQNTRMLRKKISTKNSLKLNLYSMVKNSLKSHLNQQALN